MTWHYMHKDEMKRQGFIKNKVMAWLMVVNVDKASQIPHTNVISPTFERDDGDNVWRVWSQHHFGVIYKMHAPFTKYASYTCEWALWGNFCKHKVVILLIFTDLNNGKYHWVLLHISWNTLWWFEMHVCWFGILTIGWWCIWWLGL
jgi:hypothetical protein